MDETTTFDLYVFEDGKWAHARAYHAEGKDEALADAKTRAKDNKVQAVRLLRDSFVLDKPVAIFRVQKNADLPEFDPLVLKGRGGAKRSAIAAGLSPRSGASAKGQAGRDAPPPIVVSPPAKIGLVVMGAAIVAALVTLTASKSFGVKGTGGILVFVGAAVVGFAMLMFTTLSKRDREKVFYQGPESGSKQKTKTGPTLADFEPKPVRPLVAQPDTEAQEAEEAASEADDSLVKPGGAGYGIVVKVLRFFEDALAHVVKTTQVLVGGQLDSHVRFGCHLFLAGAVDCAAAMERFPRAKLFKVIESCVVVLGTQSDQAKRFAKNYEEYLVEPKNREMFAAGAGTMDRYERKNEPPGPLLAAALAIWSAPDKTKEEAETVAIMFTDIVGSTDYTQTHGDQASQALVRAHDEIVRRAIEARAGREIKHLGDGIMACFPSAEGGVEAAVGIQSAVAAHNQMRPDLPLKLRIGVSYGRPIHENDDLFGSTVQLASRICAKTGPDEILISRGAMDALPSGTFAVESRGLAALKGFKDEQEVFGVLWS